MTESLNKQEFLQESLPDMEKKFVTMSNRSKQTADVMDKIIQICSQNDFQHISNFEWYITVLVELSRTEGGTKHGKFLLIWGESTLAKTEIL